MTTDGRNRPAIGAVSCNLVVARLDAITRETLAYAIGRDAAAHYDRERTGPICRRCCVAVADPDDPMAYCVECADRDARP